MPYTNNPYCTVSQVYSALDLSPDAQQADGAWITGDLMPQAQDLIDAYLGFSFQTDGTTQAPASRQYDGDDTNIMYVSERIVSLTQVLDASNTDITSFCVLRPTNTIPALYIKRTEDIFFSEDTYTIMGVFGRPSIPYAITRACVRTVAAWYKMRDTNYSDFIIEGMVRQHYQRELPDDIVQILAQYKPRRFRC